MHTHTASQWWYSAKKRVPFSIRYLWFFWFSLLFIIISWLLTDCVSCLNWITCPKRILRKTQLCVLSSGDRELICAPLNLHVHCCRCCCRCPVCHSLLLFQTACLSAALALLNLSKSGFRSFKTTPDCLFRVLIVEHCARLDVKCALLLVYNQYSHCYLCLRCLSYLAACIFFHPVHHR